MIETRVICDFCGQSLQVDTVVYTDGKKVDNVQLHATKEWDTKTLFPHLCKSCAEKLDRALSACKNGMTHRGLLLERNAKVNAIRREKLGTKG